ncbi:MAG: shikimate kinase [Verrucomicrobiota bacterium]|nr:shikimate kinase [Verrucomicrobiota bacterium]
MVEPRRNIALMGFMGTGKTSVGRTLAADLGMTFADMDVVIEQRQGKPISSIFSENGEQFFRTLERELVEELSAKAGLVIAAGGGIVLNPDNIRDYAGTGLVVCLSATPETILERLELDTTRPMLAGADKAAKVRGILDGRRKLYEAIPFQIDTSGLTIRQVADRILQAYHQGRRPDPQKP